MTLNELFTQYRSDLAQIHAVIGTRCVDVFDDYRMFEWFITRRNVAWCAEPLSTQSIEAGDSLYSDTFDGKVVRQEGLVFVLQDGFALVFDESKECKDAGLIELYEEVW